MRLCAAAAAGRLKEQAAGAAATVLSPVAHHPALVDRCVGLAWVVVVCAAGATADGATFKAQLPTYLSLSIIHCCPNTSLLLSPLHHCSAITATTQTFAGNHLEALPSVLPHHCLSLGLALNYYKHWRQVLPCFASLAHTLQV